MPLTLKATRSTIKMQLAAPKLKAIQKEFKEDKEAMNREVMAFYQSEGINPVGGCLPMIAQLPVFLVLFRLLRGLSQRQGDSVFFNLASKVLQANGGDPVDPQLISPQNIPDTSQMYQDLVTQTEIPFGPFDLAAQAGDILQISFGTFIPYLLLILFVLGTSYYQQYQVTARRGPDSPAVPSQQQAILKFLPLMTAVWCFFFPAGLVIYWATSNLFRIGQQSYITRSIYGDPDSDGQKALQMSKAAKQDAAGSDDSESLGSVEKVEEAPKGQIAVADKPKATPSKSKPTPNKSDKADKSDNASSREARWRQRSEEARAKAAARNEKLTGSSGSGSASGRVTPKGTQSQKKKKKR
jgi:YidC/Oxa1 family membrane protein insertase